MNFILDAAKLNDTLASVNATVARANMKRRHDEAEHPAGSRTKKAKLTPFQELSNKIRAERLWEDNFELRLKRALGEGNSFSVNTPLNGR